MKGRLLSVSLLLFFLSFVFVTPTLAERLSIGNAGNFLDRTIEPTGLEKSDVTTTTGKLIKGILGTLGIIFFVLMVYGGILWMTDRGSEEQITKAKNTIIAAVIGMTVITAAYALTTLITSRLVEKAKGSPPVNGGSVGNEPLGCCVLETGPGINACRIDTQSECQRRANIFRDNHESSGAWQFQEGVNAVECNKQC